MVGLFIEVVCVWSCLVMMITYCVDSCCVGFGQVEAITGKMTTGRVVYPVWVVN